LKKLSTNLERIINYKFNKKYSENTEDLPFQLISFKNVSFKHGENSKYVFDNYSKELYINDKIIGRVIVKISVKG